MRRHRKTNDDAHCMECETRGQHPPHPAPINSGKFNSVLFVFSTIGTTKHFRRKWWLVWIVVRILFRWNDASGAFRIQIRPFACFSGSLYNIICLCLAGKCCHLQRSFREKLRINVRRVYLSTHLDDVLCINAYFLIRSLISSERYRKN